MRGWNWSGKPGETAMWPRSTTVGPFSAQTAAASTGRWLLVPSLTSMSRASSQPLTKPAHARTPSGVSVSYEISRSARVCSCTRARIPSGAVVAAGSDRADNVAAMVGRLRALRRSETSRAAELGIAAMGANVVALVFTLVFTRVLGQSDYGSLAALVSTFLILNVPGYALQTTVAREVSGALAAGDPNAGAAVGRWLRRLLVLALVLTACAVLARDLLAQLIGVDDFPWAAAAAPLAGALWLIVSVERGALVGFQRYQLVGGSIVVEQIARLVFGLVLAGIGLVVTGAFIGTPIALALVGAALWRPLSASIGPHGPVHEEPG